MENISNIYEVISNIYLWFAIIGLCLCSVALMFYWEGIVKWWLRLPIINLFLLPFLLIAGFIEQVYLTFHPHKRNKWFKTSIYQIFFNSKL